MQIYGIYSEATNTSCQGPSIGLQLHREEISGRISARSGVIHALAAIQVINAIDELVI